MLLIQWKRWQSDLWHQILQILTVKLSKLWVRTENKSQPKITCFVWISEILTLCRFADNKDGVKRANSKDTWWNYSICICFSCLGGETDRKERLHTFNTFQQKETQTPEDAEDSKHRRAVRSSFIIVPLHNHLRSESLLRFSTEPTDFPVSHRLRVPLCHMLNGT